MDDEPRNIKLKRKQKCQTKVKVSIIDDKKFEINQKTNRDKIDSR